MNGRRYGFCAEESVSEFEEGVGSAVETAVERVAAGVESIVRFHDASMMRP